jgi:hypothetical protein
MSLVFIFALVIVGHLNTNEYTKVLSATAINNKLSPVKVKNLNSVSNSTLNQVINNSSLNNSSSPLNPTLSSTEENLISIAQEQVTNIPDSKNNFLTKNDNTLTTIENLKTISTSPIKSEVNNSEPEITSSTGGDNVNVNTSLIKPESETIITSKASAKIITSKNDDAEDANLKIKKIRKNPPLFSYYIAPSISYRSFSDNKMNKSVIHKTKIGYEAGIGMSYTIVDELRFTTGIQFNYSGYNIKASNTHPMLATLILNTDVPSQYNVYSTVSNYGNGTGNENSKLKNYSIQASIPIGLQYSFGENENYKFDAEATFQPSAIIKSNAYMLSTDGKNYLTDPYIYRKWNMSTNFGTYISFRSESYKWQVGPQIRYQMLSTYSKSYPIREHLINYGLRLGISR